MKIRNLLLGSVAAAGLSTGGAYAADLGVLTSLDVCDSLGLSGLTISSDTNCLQITGEVKYKFTWGDYGPDDAIVVDFANPDDGDVGFDAGDGEYDWESKVEAWIKFVATAESDFGPAKAVIKIRERQQSVAGWGIIDEEEEIEGNRVIKGGDDTAFNDQYYFDEAYVSIGDTTVIMAGKKGSIMNKGDDTALNFLGLFLEQGNDKGVSWGDRFQIPDGGHVIQVTSDLGNGFSVSAGLENLNGTNYSQAGTAVGVIAYSGDGITAHVTAAAAGILDGEVEDWGVHAGFTGSFDNFKVVLAGAYGDGDVGDAYWNVLASASATFDMFTIAGSVEATSEDEWGVGGSIGAAVTDGVTLNLGGRYFEESGGADVYQVAAQVVASVTETLTLTGEVGYVDHSLDGDLFYGKAGLAWAPGGGFTSSISGTVNSEEAYKIETEFKKTFQ